MMRDPDHLRKLLEQTDEVWSPKTQIAHYDVQLAECDEKDRGIAAELAELRGNATLANIRALLIAEAEAN